MRPSIFEEAVTRNVQMEKDLLLEILNLKEKIFNNPMKRPSFARLFDFLLREFRDNEELQQKFYEEWRSK